MQLVSKKYDPSSGWQLTGSPKQSSRHINELDEDILQVRNDSSMTSSFTSLLSMSRSYNGVLLCVLYYTIIGPVEEYMVTDSNGRQTLPDHINGVSVIGVEDGFIQIADTFLDENEPTLLLNHASNITIEKIQEWLTNNNWNIRLANQIWLEFEAFLEDCYDK